MRAEAKGSIETLPKQIEDVLANRGIVQAMDGPVTQNVFKNRLLQYIMGVKRIFGDYSLLQTSELTPETLTNFINLLVKVNDPVKLK